MYAYVPFPSFVLLLSPLHLLTEVAVWTGLQL